MENDYFSKKESIFHIWMLEFEEFKERLLSINELKKIVTTFDYAAEDLKGLQKTFYEEELTYLRQEINHRENNNDKLLAVLYYLTISGLYGPN